MHKINILALLIISLFALSSCTSNTGHQVEVSTNAVEKPEAMTGINKGNLPPDFTIRTIDGKQYTLSNFRKESKPILLYFWASWCPYCSRDFDVVKNIYPKYADKVTFLAIDLDPNEKADLINNYKND